MSREEQHESFADLIGELIHQSNLTITADRLVVHESSLRQWRQGDSPNLKTLQRLRFTEEEFLRLLRIIAAGRAVIEPTPTAEASSSSTPADIHNRLLQLGSAMQSVSAGWLGALGGGPITQSHQRAIEESLDAMLIAVRRLRPQCFRTCRQTGPQRALAMIS